MKLLVLTILLALGIASCSVPEDYIRSIDAPKLGTKVSETTLNKFLDSAQVPKANRFDPFFDSLPNRTYYRPTAFLFKGIDTLVNLNLCNSHYKDMESTISFYSTPSRWVESYPLHAELKSLKDAYIDSLPEADYYLIFYWSLTEDNLNWRNIQSLQKSLKEDGLSLMILYVNVDNREHYNLTKNEFWNYMLDNRTISTEYNKKWFRNK